MQFLLYCFCGGIGVLTDFGVYYVLLAQGVWYQFANIFGYLAGTLISFFLNRLITFRVRDSLVGRLMMFLGVAIAGFATSTVLLWLFVDAIQMDSKLAKLLTLPLVVVLQYSLNRKITFTPGRR